MMERQAPGERDVQRTSWYRSARAEAPGYFAMVAFLFAYLLNVMGSGRVIQAVLNLAGAIVGALYLKRKRALPSVISNLAWAAITVVGLLVDVQSRVA